MKLILVSNIIFFQDLRILLYELQGGKLNIFICRQIQRVQKLREVPALHIVIPELLILLPEQETGICQAAFSGAEHGIGIIEFLIIRDLFPLQKFIVELDKFLKGNSLPAELSDHHFLQISTALLDPSAVHIQFVAVQIVFHLQAQTGVQSLLILQCSLQFFAAPLHIHHVQVAADCRGHAEPFGRILLFKSIGLIKIAEIVLVKPDLPGFHAVPVLNFPDIPPDNLAHALPGQAVFLGNAFQCAAFQPPADQFSAAFTDTVTAFQKIGESSVDTVAAEIHILQFILRQQAADDLFQPIFCNGLRQL